MTEGSASASKKQVAVDWTKATGLTDLGKGLLARRAGGFLFGVELDWSGSRRDYYEPRLFCTHLASQTNHLTLSYSEPLRNYKGAPDQVTFRAHAKRVAEAARRLAAAAPAPLDGAAVDAKRVLEIYRSHFANFIVSKPIRYADMALIACDAAGEAAGNQIMAQARADVTSDEFVRWLAPVVPLVSDRKRLHEVANEKLALLKLQKAGESPWASEV